MGIGKIDLPLAESIANKVRDHVMTSMNRVEVAGSIRRRKEVVGDIEICGIPDDREKLIKLLGNIGQHIKPGVPGAVPWVPKVEAKYLRVRLEEGINLDVFLGTPQNWGGLFMMRTGSGASPDGNAFHGFIPAVFQRWKKLSAGGRMTNVMPTMPTGEQLWVPEEQDFFDLLEMNFVPPEERISKKIIKNYVKQLK
jgi:DNA polymerase/3'-5' exonuclease PolX